MWNSTIKPNKDYKIPKVSAKRQAAIDAGEIPKYPERPPLKRSTKPLPKSGKPIAKVSAKRKVLNVEYRAIVAEMAKEDNRCEVKSPVCTLIMQGANHKQKRLPSNLILRKNLERSCNACNGYIETHQQWAEDNGHFISRFVTL